MTANKKKKLIRITTVPSSFFGLLQGQLNYMSNYFEVLAISSQSKEYGMEELAKREGVRYDIVEMTRKITPIKDFMSLLRMYRILKKEKPYIVHSHTPKAGTIGMIAAKLAGVPHRLHTVAGLPLVESNGLKKLLLVYVDKLTYRCATKVYPNSFGLKDIMLKEKLAKKSKLNVIANGSSNGIDTNHFNPDLYNQAFKESFRKELNISNKDFVYFFAGRLVKDKGINELISAFKRLNEEHVNTKLLLAGGDEKELDPLLPETNEIMRSNSNIIQTGWVKDVRPYFAISDTLVFPSYREGFPNVVLQACSMKLASIVTDINGCNEIVENNTNGLIIPPKNEDELYRAMKYLLTHQDITDEMSSNSRLKIAENYERVLVWQSLLKEYNKLN